MWQGGRPGGGGDHCYYYVMFIPVTSCYHGVVLQVIIDETKELV